MSDVKELMELLNQEAAGLHRAVVEANYFRKISATRVDDFRRRSARFEQILRDIELSLGINNT